MEERCPCKKHRLLVEYEEGGTTIDALYPKAAIEMAFPGTPASNGTFPIHATPIVGSATCKRLSCKLLRRC